MNAIRNALLAVMVAAASIASPRPALAHAPGQAYMFLRVHGDSTLVRLELHLADLDRALALGWDTSALPSRALVLTRLAEIRAYAEPRFGLGPLDQRLAPVYRDFGFREAESGAYLLLEYLIAAPLAERVPITMTTFFELESTHRNVVVIEHNWRTGTFDNESAISLILSPREPTQELDLTDATLWRGFLALVRQGVWHIWIGLDHILFLVALILPSVLRREGGRWQPAPRFTEAGFKLLTIVTSFTLAHTVTLSLAALGTVSLPSRLVESLIAVSIAAAAWHNLRPFTRVHEAGIAFAFGLFHGFGFASVLGDLGLGNEHLVLSLLGFNLGVEVGQVAIVAAIFPVLYLLRRTRAYVVSLQVASLGLIAIGLLWAAERTFGFNVPVMTLLRAAFGLAGTGAPS